MTTQEVLQTARAALAMGISVAPIPANGTKCPTGKWEQYQTKRITIQEFERQLNATPDSGLCFICGPVSNNLEMLDFDNRDIYIAFKERAIEKGLEDLINRIEAGYCEYTPKGAHYFYFLQGAGLGNKKLASRQKFNPETGELLFKLDKKGKKLKEIEGLIETRGKGGLGVVAPSSGKVHPSGNPYVLVSGGVETIVTLTSEEHEQLIALAKSFDKLPAKEDKPKQTRVKGKPSGDGLPANSKPRGTRPGDFFNAVVGWKELLENYDWTHAYDYTSYCPADNEYSCNFETDNDCPGHEVGYWIRPGKKQGVSATTNYYGSDKIYIFTTSTELDNNRVYDKYGFYTRFEFDGETRPAAISLRNKGFLDHKPEEFQVIKNGHEFLKTFAPEMAGAVKPAPTPNEDDVPPPGDTDEPPFGEEPPPSKPITQHELNDSGNARRVVDYAKGTIKWNRAWGWLTWDGKRWKKDENNHILNIAREATKFLILEEAKQATDSARSKALTEFYLQSGNNSRLNAMVATASYQSEIAVDIDLFDSNHWLFNCKNGTLDLQTGEFSPANRGNYITKLAGTSYNPDAKCPLWESFLNRIMGGNQNLIDFLQRAVGYSLTGLTREQVIFLMYGTGDNGKSTFLEAVLKMLGDYGDTANAETFLKQDRPAGQNPARNDLAKLPGKRFVKAVEAEEGRKLAQSLVKELTGGDTFTARFTYEREFSFKPVCKIWFAANHKPVVENQDRGIWRRIKLIPFTVQIPEEEKDTALPEKLETELEGILAWAVKGCLIWQKEGLNPPQEVEAATAEYKAESDVLAEFMSECCAKGKKETVSLKDIYKAYLDWFKDNEGNKKLELGKQAFRQKLTEQCFFVTRSAKDSNAMMVFGLGLTKSKESKEKSPNEGYVDDRWLVEIDENEEI